MPRDYDDDRYIEWVQELNQLIVEFLDTAGNTEESLEGEIENAVENAKAELGPPAERPPRQAKGIGE